HRLRHDPARAAGPARPDPRRDRRACTSARRRLEHAWAMETRYELLEHTADLAIRVRGADLAELLGNLSYAILDLMVEAGGVEPRETHPISIIADSPEDLLVAWANEILYWADSERLLLPFVEGMHAEGTRAEASLRGERLDPARHLWKGELKAATHHDLALARDPSGGLLATLVIDV